MFLNTLFYDAPVDFKKRCRMRIFVGAAFLILGGISVIAAALFGNGIPVAYLEPGARTFIPDFYTWTGIGLMAGGAVSIFRNCRYLKREELFKKRAVEESDERNRLLGLRSWAYAGYTMFLLLYLGVLVSGFISKTAVVVLLTVIAGYAAMLFFFRLILSRIM